jgi:hypothetical protein
MTSLEQGSLILFGSSYSAGFALDTVFVVGSYEQSQEVATRTWSTYPKVYREVTLEQLGNDYRDPSRMTNLRLYSGDMYSPGKDMFSYVPCKPFGSSSPRQYDRLLIPYGEQEGLGLSSFPTGIKYLGESRNTSLKLWRKVTQFAIEKGYHLGVGFEMPGLQSFSERGDLAKPRHYQERHRSDC